MRAPFLDSIGPPTRAERIKARIPWFVKVGAKLLVSRAPLGYGIWSRLNLFKLGEMRDPRYAYEVYRWHHERVRRWLPAALAVLELGPGDSLATAVVARAFGAGRTILVDVGPYANASLAAYHEVARYCATRGTAVPDVSRCSTVGDVLQAVGGEYLTGGQAALAALPAGSIDFAFSQHVLEHVRRAEFDATMAALFRAQRSGGVGSHSIDLDDHMGGSLNSLRFSPARWEGEGFASSGFYSNRLRASELLRVFADVGYEVVDKIEYRWQALPLARVKLDQAFQHFDDGELCVRGVDVILRKP